MIPEIRKCMDKRFEGMDEDPVLQAMVKIIDHNRLVSTFG